TDPPIDSTDNILLMYTLLMRSHLLIDYNGSRPQNFHSPSNNNKRGRKYMAILLVPRRNCVLSEIFLFSNFTLSSISQIPTAGTWERSGR
ncbi:hypothetical protein PENTCL1PPCAC_5319, partial [Pristionchus entomophagus]